MKKTWLILLVLARLSQAWYCGGVTLEDKKCKCGASEVWTYEEFDNNGRQCCGRDTCFLDENGDAVCPDGVPCTTKKYEQRHCGDVLIADEKTCYCGKETLSSSVSSDVWC